LVRERELSTIAVQLWNTADHSCPPPASSVRTTPYAKNATAPGQTGQVAKELDDVSIGGAADQAADLDLTVLDARGDIVGQSGSPTADESVSLANPAAGTGGSAKVPATVTVAAPAAEGRELVGVVRLVNGRGTTVGTGEVIVRKVTP
jgi:hypothetical protein